jgi:putative transposase
VSRLAPETLKLSNDEQAELEQLIKRHNTPQQIVLRGKIVLYANLGKNNREISRILNISRNMVILWRNRWLASSGSELLTSQRLEDLERVGTPAKFSMEQVIELFALACSHPVDYGRQISHWTARELVDEIMKQGIIESISVRHVGRLLEEAELKPHALSLLVNPPLWMKNLILKLKILQLYIPEQLSVTKTESTQSPLMK